ncbi:hypothetical protein CHS0354_014361 [Potamilus streckersoni]|uniref:Uncharacterized protein n=1 Tax=Potamilus streckersoni TaxID=2493646 RepID=A0AAE0SLA2_9BIVA|nr:hypothetical protein CHS0354_014361 [Potamilus streckersoni]
MQGATNPVDSTYDNTEHIPTNVLTDNNGDTTTTKIRNPSAKQTTKCAPTTPTQTSLNDNGRKPQSRQTPSKDPPYYMHHQEKPSLSTTSLKTQPVYQISRQHHNPRRQDKNQPGGNITTLPLATQQLYKTATTTTTISRITSTQHS